MKLGGAVKSRIIYDSECNPITTTFTPYPNVFGTVFAPFGLLFTWDPLICQYNTPFYRTIILIGLYHLEKIVTVYLWVLVYTLVLQ